jgi:hypothetical protein
MAYEDNSINIPEYSQTANDEDIGNESMLL